jgi:glycosyltransferase involved in cell wall biosynthesis
LQEKGLDHFLEMASYAHSAHKNMHFVVVGPQDASDPLIYKKVLEAQEQGIVSYEGVHKDVRPFLEKTHFLVLLSKYREGIPRTLMEAASMARPVITTNVPGCREMVPRGATGFLLPPNNLDSLLELCDTLPQMPMERLTAMGQEGRVHVQDHYSDSVVLAFYDRVLINFLKGVS